MAINYDPSKDWDRHIHEQDLAELGECADRIEKLLINRNEGRNLKCWPLCSFGWKDADLDPEGCTGIEAIEEITDAWIYVKIGGHKSLSSPSYEPEWDLPEDVIEPYADTCQEIVCSTDFGGEWEGDRWTLHFRDFVKVPWIYNDQGEIDESATADAIIEAAREACQPFEQEMASMSESFNSIWKELDNLDGHSR